MKLPALEHAYIPVAKITGYLLSTTHPVGRPKATYFLRRGFSADNWPRFADSPLDHARAHEVTEEVASQFGITYIVEGSLRAPDGTDPHVRGVWFVEHGEPYPRLVSAYPIPR